MIPVHDSRLFSGISLPSRTDYIRHPLAVSLVVFTTLVGCDTQGVLLFFTTSLVNGEFFSCFLFFFLRAVLCELGWNVP